MMLDTKRTWDDLVTLRGRWRQARILDNHYYQQISSALAGSQEFMAGRSCSSCTSQARTSAGPRHAAGASCPHFLDAPKKMMGFMDSVLKVFWRLGWRVEPVPELRRG